MLRSASRLIKKNVTGRFRPTLSLLLVGFTLLLSVLGLLFVFEASSAESYNLVGHQYYFLRQQAISLFLGSGAFVVALLLPTKFWAKTAQIWFGVGLVLLILVLVPGFGVELNGARRWFAFQGVIFQPVEFFKLALVLFSAVWMSRQLKLPTFLFLTALFSLLLLLQPDMGSLLVLLWVIFGLFFLAGGKLLLLSGLGVLGVVGLLLLIVASPYRAARLQTYLDPNTDPLGSGFHVRQITLALANGGWFGVGLGNSQQKYSYIPEVSSDSIFAIVAEEIGFVGALVVIGLFVGYLITLYRIATLLPERSFEQLFVLGVFLWMSGQILLNLAAVAVLVPLTGLPLPFFSSGGTALFTILFTTGLVLKIFLDTSARSASSRKKVQS
ncbi:MAG: Bacterial cell division membrane protein [Candidatus Pacebacteria bacterium GW2011_GWB1_47_8]|nr:MAG: Bacterial cell division membrane protein [Candidatus Pacebacteria bacterium GW2011_GWA1_46_10]KKU84456.1 MAG: Bacterial cell division membrane protein [Candidatus Pacebacteria bacterium GW2011_GWB1_47_8]HCR81113.1 cell division protein FtsW [Candidatus Paceibacterota bacterium]